MAKKAPGGHTFNGNPTTHEEIGERWAERYVRSIGPLEGHARRLRERHDEHAERVRLWGMPRR